MVVVDASVWIDHLRGRATPHTIWIGRELSRQRIGLVDITLGEVLSGCPDDARFEDARAWLAGFEIFPSGGVGLALRAAHNYRVLRTRGRTPRDTIDGWIATFCLLHGHALLHNDRDFDHYEEVLGLRVIHP